MSHARDLTEVAPGVWTATARLWASLTTVVVADDGACLVVDPGIAAAEVTALAAELTDRGWTPVAGFATHGHWDHVLWSADLGEVPRWATSVTVAQAAGTYDDAVQQAEADAPGHDHSLTGRLTALPDDAGEVPWAGRRAVVVGYRAHCRGSAALVLPESGVLVAGDMLSDVEVPLLDLEATDPIGDHHVALDALEATARDVGVRTLIPGHGHVTDRAGLRRRAQMDRAYLDALASEAPVDDPRLADPWVAAEHANQVRWVRDGGGD